MKVENDVPYVSQFATDTYAEKVLRDKTDIRTDPNWRETGAETLDEYALWAMTQCGMACTVMALHFFKCEVPPIVTLAKDAFAHCVYRKIGDGLSGMHYFEYCEWVPRYGIRARFYTRLGLRGIEYALSRGALVIAGANPNIRGYITAPKEQKGGHLVLITGYDRTVHTITFNNPSGFVDDGTCMHTVPASQFFDFYTHRGIVLTKIPLA
ncbi:MAG: C39 family peptidase [Minisyncoccota bacterium]